MNTYNDNLHSSVVNSLNTQELEIQSIQAALDASVYTLYYAQGAKIIGEEQLSQARSDYDLQARIKKQAVDCHCLSVNVNATALDQKKYTSASVTNTATAAADVQIATNAIIRLAGDMGSIFSIVSAADYGTDIYQQSKNAYEKMNRTAYEAEQASRLSMEASSLVAEVPYSTVADQAKSGNDAVTSMLGITTKDFDDVTNRVAATNDRLAQASDAEKVAEGVVEYVNADYLSAKKAFLVNNAELNLDLRVPQKKLTSDSYTVIFNNYISPFHNVIEKAGESADAIKQLTSDKMTFPVDSYYIFLVKNVNQPVFSIAEAEGLILSPGSDRYLKVQAPPILTISAEPGVDKSVLFDFKAITCPIMINQIKDTDGNAMVLGEEYVVFVLAVFDPVYQKLLNNFDEYLTASSEKFSLTNVLASPSPDHILVIPGGINTESKDCMIKSEEEKNNTLQPLKITQTLNFCLIQNAGYKVEYRCMFLPDNTNLLLNLLTENELKKIEDEVLDFEFLQERIISKITELNAAIARAEADERALSAEIENTTDKEKQKELKKNHRELEETIKVLQLDRSLLETELKEIMKLVFKAGKTVPGFFFNLNLAEKITKANYLPASMGWPEGYVPTYTLPIPPVGKELIKGSVKIEPGTTDNFGNPLIDGKKYLPVVLSFSTDEESRDFTNSLSDFSETTLFIYNS